MAIIKKRLGLPQTFNEILHILSVTIFEKMPIFQAFSQKNNQTKQNTEHKQLLLFDL
jgi:hypothetical protein